ncbi:MAG: regulator of ribonuclease activity A [Parasphingorhabdus sp.]|jgi:regulator of ribonuclease activity A
MNFKTADLYDEFSGDVQVVGLPLKDYGGRLSFCGEIQTIRVPRDFLLIKQMLSSEGKGRVLVIDGDGAMNYALLGDRLAQFAVDNNWAGVLVNGSIRDSVDIGKLDLGVKALGTCPARPAMNGDGETDIDVSFGDVTYRPGDYLYADPDGVLVKQVVKITD